MDIIILLIRILMNILYIIINCICHDVNMTYTMLIISAEYMDSHVLFHTVQFI